MQSLDSKSSEPRFKLNQVSNDNPFRNLDPSIETLMEDINSVIPEKKGGGEGDKSATLWIIYFAKIRKLSKETLIEEVNPVVNE